jgi:hypothetical protein
LPSTTTLSGFNSTARKPPPASASIAA